MKKTVTRPDGTKEEIEGTGEEIAAYEQAMKKKKNVESVEKKGPGILLDHLKLDKFEWDKFKIDHGQTCEITTAQSGWWSVVPPRCTCGAVAYTVPIITYETTTSSTTIGEKDGKS